jgi:hypothetical protein
MKGKQTKNMLFTYLSNLVSLEHKQKQRKQNDTPLDRM